MKERGKAVDAFNSDIEYYCSSDLPCKKHPYSSSVGICAYCLKDRLIKLVCSDCGEQRLSSCSCSDMSSVRNSCSVEVGSVGRVSFLIENEKGEISQSHSKPRTQEKSDEVVMLKRSSSSCVEIKRSGFWKIGRLFRKKREKTCERSNVGGGCDEKSDLWLVDYMGVSRSRSLCSFRGGGGWFGSEDGGDLVVSGARSSISAARSSGVNGGLLLDSARRSGFSEAEPRKSWFDGEKKDDLLESEKGADFKKLKRGGVLEPEAAFNGASRRVFSLKESDSSCMDDSGFIDLKLDYSSESKEDFSAAKVAVLSDSGFGSMRGCSFVAHECGGVCSFDSFRGYESFRNGDSCRITLNERRVKKGRKSMKGWRWIFKHHERKKDEDLMFKS